MSSIKSKLIIGMIRNRHLFKFKLKRETVDDNFSIMKFREQVDRASDRTRKLPEAVKTISEPVNGMHAEWIVTDNAPKDKIILYIHGGGFISGSCHTHRMHVAKFVQGTGINALLFDYRLAPEHAFPEPLEDCAKAYDYLIEKGYSPDNILVCGESAGGTLTLSLLKFLKERGDVMPSAAVAISPVTDLSCKAASFEKNAKKDIAPYNSWNVWTKCYIGNNDVTNPVLSPQFGDLRGLPHIFLCVGTHEIHFDDVVNFAKKAEKYGTEVTLSIWEDMVHAFPIMAPLFPEAKKAMYEICLFIRESLL